MKKIENVGLIFLFSITFFKCGINADIPEIPRDIVVQVKNILEIFENYINNHKVTANDEFISYFNEFGKRIARILSSTSEHDTWWLWQLSILSNSVDKIYQPLEIMDHEQKLLKKFDKAIHIATSIKLIQGQIDLYLKEYEDEDEIVNLKKDFKELSIHPKKRKRIVDCPPTFVETIDSIPLKLKTLDKNIRVTFDINTDEIVHFYTPQNLFFFDIILNETSIQTLFTDCSAIKWKTYKQVLIESYNKAMDEWVDIKESYIALIKYRETLIGAVKLSFYIHIKLHMSFAMGFLMAKDKRNIEIWNSLWESTKKLVEDFIEYFDLDEDSDLTKLNKLMDVNMDSLWFQKMYNIAGTQFYVETPLYQLTHDNMANHYVLDVMNRGKNLEPLAQQNYTDLKNYLENVKTLFKNVDFNSYNIFYLIIPYKYRYA